MKKMIAVVCTILASSSVMAGMSGLNKGSEQMNALSSAWRSQSNHHQQSKNDIAIVYGGDDVSNRSIQQIIA